MKSSFSIIGEAVFKDIDLLKGISKSIVLWNEGSKLLASSRDNKGNIISLILDTDRSYKDKPIPSIELSFEAFKSICKGRKKLTFIIDQFISVHEENTTFKVTNLEYSSYNGASLSVKPTGKFESFGLMQENLNKLSAVDELINICYQNNSILFYVVRNDMAIRVTIPTNYNLDFSHVLSSFVIKYLKLPGIEVILDKEALYFKSDTIFGKLGVIEAKRTKDQVNTLLEANWSDFLKCKRIALLDGIKKTSGSSILLNSNEGKLLLKWRSYGTMTISDTLDIKVKPLEKPIKLSMKNIKTALSLMQDEKVTIKVDGRCSKVLITSGNTEILVATLYGE
jgi:hypothetical protein